MIEVNWVCIGCHRELAYWEISGMAMCTACAAIVAQGEERKQTRRRIKAIRGRMTRVDE